jgi:hypothetical protein
MKSETPRTEAFQKAVIQNIAPADASHWYDTAQKTASFARDLERELSQWREMADRLTDFLPGGHPADCNCQKCDAYREFKQLRSAAMPNVES